jgi:hypothetical protein
LFLSREWEVVRDGWHRLGSVCYAWDHWQCHGVTGGQLGARMEADVFEVAG